MFKGGVNLKGNKLTSSKAIEFANKPSKVILPLIQHIGAPCEPIVNKDDCVKVGQKIAESKAPFSVPIHTPISGIVKSIEQLPHPITGKPTQSIIIESDNQNNKDNSNENNDNNNQDNKLNNDYLSYTSDKLLNIIKDSGIVGLGGAAFPTHIKLSPPKGISIDTLIINGAECEPFLTSDHRLMIENSEEIIKGILIVAKVLKTKKVFIGIEENKKDAIRIMNKKINNSQKFNIDNIKIKVVSLPTKYPQGAEKMLIYSLTKRKVPTGELPMNVGCVVQNIGTVYAIYQAVALSKPLYERVVTITGKVNNPKNLMVKIGTPISELIKMAGGYKGEPKKLINGGPMMGVAMPSDDLPIIKSTSGIVVFNQDDIYQAEMPIECIRCGRCVNECPMNLNPTLIARYAEKGRIDLAEKTYAMDCIECGCCSFGCPSKISLVHWIRYAKSEIKNNKSK
jgi:Na+-translocating ferredoxin:NAD+ oxidoreductase subunit C